jgi:hypothetical protein
VFRQDNRRNMHRLRYLLGSIYDRLYLIIR